MIGLFVAVRGMLFLLAYLAAFILPRNPRATPADPHVDLPWLRIWAEGDVLAYLRLAESGYGPGDGSLSPVFALLWRAAALLGAPPFLVAAAVSQVSLLVAMILLYRLAQRLLESREDAQRAVLYALLYPGMLFTVAYPDGIYLALAVGSFLALASQSWLVAGLAGGWAAAVRLLGLGTGVAWLVAYLQAHLQARTHLDRHLLALVVWLSSLGTGVLIAGVQAGDLLAYLTTPGDGFGPRVARPPWETVRQAVQVLLPSASPPAEGVYAGALLGLFGGALFLVLGLAALGRLGPAYGIYVLLGLAAALVFPPAGDRPLAALLRQTAALFPAFLVLAVWGRHALVDRIVITTFAMLLGVLAALFVRGWPVPGGG